MLLKNEPQLMTLFITMTSQLRSQLFSLIGQLDPPYTIIVFDSLGFEITYLKHTLICCLYLHLDFAVFLLFILSFFL